MALPEASTRFAHLLSFARLPHLLFSYAISLRITWDRRTLIRWEQGEMLPDSKAMVLELARSLKLDDQETRQLLEASLTALTLVGSFTAQSVFHRT